MANKYLRKGMWIWNVPNIENGDPVLITVKLIEAGIKEVYIKAANGPYIFKFGKDSPFSSWGENLRQELVDQLHAAGIKVYGWGFCYGHDPKGEGKIAGMQVERFGLDGWLFDVESEADRQEKADSNGVHTCLEFRKISDKPIYLCWWSLYKNPNQDPKSNNRWHPDTMPAKQLISAWDTYVDGYFPMAYWDTDEKYDPDGLIAAPLLAERCIVQYRELTQKSIYIVGRAYTGDSGVVTEEAMKDFANVVTQHEYDGLSWWSMEHAVKMDWPWEVIGEINDGIEDPEMSDEEVIEVSDPTPNPSPDQERGKWRTVTEDHLNLRIAPGKVSGTERGGLMAGDEVETLPGGMIYDGISYVPVVMYVAEDYLA